MTYPVFQDYAGRPVTMAPRGMVTSPHALASEAGVAALRSGGSAVDAAIAASAVLSVVYPHMTGIGGDAFWLIHDPERNSVACLDGAGAAARTGTIEAFLDRGHSEIPHRGPLPATLTTPGAVAAWQAAHDAYGQRTLADNLAPAVELARDGFPVTTRLANWIAVTEQEGSFNDGARKVFLAGGSPPRPGAKLTNPALARSLLRIASDGRTGFYEGETAAALAGFSRSKDGFFDETDLRAQHAQWKDSIHGTYRGVTIHETPPPTQGFCVLEMLNILEAYEVGTWDFQGVDHVHHVVQAKQIAYHDRDRLLSDPSHVPVPVERLVSKDYAASRRARIDPARALPWDEIPSYGSLAGDTVFIAAVDKRGRAAALIHSVYGVFGSGVLEPATGIVLQNRSAYFSLDPDHPNALAPGKKPAHTLIASMAFCDGRLEHVVGCMGADGQPQIHVQAYMGMLDFGLDIQQAVSMPRWLSGRFGLGEPRDLLHMESRIPESTIDGLLLRGHNIDVWGDYSELAGHAHGISIDPESGVRMGGADPRSDGSAIGY